MPDHLLLPSRESPRSAGGSKAPPLRGLVKKLLGPDWRFRAHRLARLRWITKYKIVRKLKPEVGLRTKLAFVLLDPEIESYSYELANERELVRALAGALGRPESELGAFAEETRRDAELNDQLARHVRWRFDVKRRVPLGHRLAWYLIVRARKPRLVVETGIYRGLGSLVLLRALERNREDGCPGELISFDVASAAGGLVRSELRDGWARVIGSTHDLLPTALAGREVEMLFQDTPHTVANQRFEFGAALAHAGARLLLVDGSGGDAPTLEALVTEHDGTYHRVPAPSRNHVYAGSAIAFGVFDGCPALAAEGRSRSG